MAVEEHYSAFPKLMGAPAYARPPMPVAPVARPFDPDELPLQIEQTPEERALVDSVAALDLVGDVRGGIGVAPVPATGMARGVAGGGGASAGPGRPTAHATSPGGPGGSPETLPGRPFFLRELTDRLRARR